MVYKVFIKNGYIINDDKILTDINLDEWSITANPDKYLITIKYSKYYGGGYYKCNCEINGKEGFCQVNHKGPRMRPKAERTVIPVGMIDGYVTIIDSNKEMVKKVLFEDMHKSNFMTRYSLCETINVEPNNSYILKPEEYLITDGGMKVNDNIITVTNSSWVCIRNTNKISFNGVLYSNRPFSAIDMDNYRNIYSNFTKELHIWFDKNYPDNCLHAFSEVKLAISNCVPVIHTTLTHFLRGEYIMLGYKIFIHPVIGNSFELKLNSRTNNGKLIKYTHNIEYVVLNGGLDTISRSVTGY